MVTKLKKAAHTFFAVALVGASLSLAAAPAEATPKKPTSTSSVFGEPGWATRQGR